MRAAPVIIAAAVAGVAAVGVAAAVASDGDEVRQVGAVSVGAVTVDATDSSPSAGATADPTPSSSTTTDDSSDDSIDDSSDRATDDSTDAPTSRQVEGLDELRGVLTRDDDDRGDDGDDGDGDRDGEADGDDDGDDRDDFEVAGVDLELGPDGWLLGAGPVADFDGDGTTAAVVVELEGLLGQEVVVLGRFDDDGDDIEVYEIQGLTFRDSAGGPAPWQSGDEADALTRDQVVEAALDAVGADSRLDSVDREDDGGATWEVEVYDAQGREQRVLLDAAGTVLDIRPED